MLLYVNGDSHSAGHDAGGPSLSYGKHIANYLKADFICEAIPGCANDSIIYRTKKFLENKTPDLVIIGWSTWERETWDHLGQSYNITASGFDNVHPDLKEKYKQWVIDSCEPEFQQVKEYNNHQKIWDFHQLLLDKNIKHFFFNCYSYFFYITAFNKTKHNWCNNYLDPYSKDSTYYFWLESKGFQPANPQYYHYGADAHYAWAEHLLPHIQLL